MRRKIFAVSALLAAICSLSATATATAQEEVADLASVVESRQFVPQHELRLSAGYYPVPASGNYHNYYHHFAGDYDYLGDRYSSGYLVHKTDRMVSGAWTLSYDYRIKKWVDIGASLSYYGEYSSLYSNVDNTLLRRLNFTCISVMPVVRFTWLNRPWVRMYGSTGLGVRFDTGRRQYGRSLTAFAGQISVGLAVGKSFFGFAEVGAGAHGVLIAGFGYKFNAKSERR